MVKRLSYEKIRISTLGGAVDITPSADGWAVRYEQPSDAPRVSYGKTIEEAGQHLIEDLKRLVNAIEEDLKAFVERNK